MTKKHSIERLLESIDLTESVDWTELEYPDVSERGLSSATHSGVLIIFDMPVRCYRLADGSAVFDANDVEKIFGVSAPLEMVFIIALGNIKIEGTDMKFSAPDSNLAPVTINVSTPAGNDPEGNPWVFAGPLSYTNSDDSIATIAPSADTMSVVVTRTGKAGTTTVSVTDGTLPGSFDMETTGAEAPSMVFTQAAPAAASTQPAAAGASAATASSASTTA